MSISVVRLGTSRGPREGIRLGTVRHPPRGVRKQDYARRDFFDVWLPELAPRAELVSWGRSEPWPARRWAAFERKYRREMRDPAARHLIAALAALSADSHFAFGGNCADESRWHGLGLRALLRDEGASLT